jgi:hypothetical protein
MALLNRNAMTWLIRTVGAMALAGVFAAAVAVPAFAHDGGDNNEVVTYGPNACTAVVDLPTYPSATCIKHKTELDEGVTETKNSYAVQAAADQVRQSYEATFQTNGWTVVEVEQDAQEGTWEYSIVKAGHQVEVKVEAQEPDEGTGTAFSFTEK